MKFIAISTSLSKGQMLDFLVLILTTPLTLTARITANKTTNPIITK
jgi:hypothetical protein